MKLLSLRALSVSLACTAVACDGRQPVTPTPIVTNVPSTTTPRPALVTYRVAGLVVDGGDVPVADAGLTVYGASAVRTNVTDASGAYDMTIEARQRGVEIKVQKPGYEPSRHWVSLDSGQVTSRNLRLHEIRNITAGQSMHLSINLDDPGCGFELYKCRRARVRSPSPGTLTLEVVPDRVAAQFGIVLADQEPGRATARLSVPATAGSEIAIDIVGFKYDDAEGFSLNTAFQPN